jgi:GTP 3',8-cyclase
MVMTDPFGRKITYLRLSVTDRCDLRCVYCMPEHMDFLPKSDVLTLEELQRLSASFIDLGIRKIRLTGGEPLVRRNVMTLFEMLGRRVQDGDIDEVTLTTNGTQLERFAAELSSYGVRRINVSVDSLDPDIFRKVTRGGDLNGVKRGIDQALASGIAIKINAVALRGVNDQHFDQLLSWCGDRGMDLCLIESMPMGDVMDRFGQYLPLTEARQTIAQSWTLTDIPYRTGGPANYVRVEQTGARLGFITPMTHNFCEGCNRVRVTCTGTLFMCLGQEDQEDVRQAIVAAIGRKPKGHDFILDREHQGASISRSMSQTGG